jgi:hypothetical protein
MEKFVKQPTGKVELFEVVNDVELKVAVKRFVMRNITRLIASRESSEVIAQNVSQIVHFLVNEGVDELLHSLNIVKAMNDKQNNTTH